MDAQTNSSGLINVQLDSRFPCLRCDTQEALDGFEGQGYSFEDKLNTGDPTIHRLPGSSVVDPADPDRFYRDSADAGVLTMALEQGTDVQTNPPFAWCLASRQVDLQGGFTFEHPTVIVETEVGPTFYSACLGVHSYFPNPCFTRVY
jgi:hypothetical protein